jgi:hypothetical protein
LPLNPDAIFGSNLAVTASNKVFNDSNSVFSQAIFGSNTSIYGSNLSFFLSNNPIFRYNNSNVFTLSNLIIGGSNINSGDALTVSGTLSVSSNINYNVGFSKSNNAMTFLGLDPSGNLCVSSKDQTNLFASSGASNAGMAFIKIQPNSPTAFTMNFAKWYQDLNYSGMCYKADTNGLNDLYLVSFSNECIYMRRRFTNGTIMNFQNELLNSPGSFAVQDYGMSWIGKSNLILASPSNSITGDAFFSNNVTITGNVTATNLTSWSNSISAQALYGSNSAVWGSNAVVWGSNAVVSASNSITTVTAQALYGSNAVVSASNSITTVTAQALYGSNAAVWGSNAVVSASNSITTVTAQALYGSNAAVWGSNAAVWGSNAAVWGSNAVVSASNSITTVTAQALYGSNAAVWGSNAAVWGSNAAVWGSNAVVSANNSIITVTAQALYGSNAAVWGSNAAVWGSNAAVWGSNAVVSANNSITTVTAQASYGSNAAVWGSNAVVSANNSITTVTAQASYGSNAAVWGSNASVWGSNASVWGSNASVWGSNTVVSANNNITTVTSQALYGSNTSVAASNKANSTSNSFYAFSNTVAAGIAYGVAPSMVIGYSSAFATYVAPTYTGSNMSGSAGGAWSSTGYTYVANTWYDFGSPINVNYAGTYQLTNTGHSGTFYVYYHGASSGTTSAEPSWQMRARCGGTYTGTLFTRSLFRVWDTASQTNDVRTIDVPLNGQIQLQYNLGWDPAGPPDADSTHSSDWTNKSTIPWNVSATAAVTRTVLF